MALRWIEDIASVVNQQTKRGLLQSLAINITANGADNDWKLSYPADLSSIENVFTLTHQTGSHTVFIEFSRPEKFTASDGTVKDNFHFMEVRFGTNYTAPSGGGLYDIGTWEDDCGSVRTRFAWFKTETKAYTKGWLPVRFWISATSSSLAIVLEGSPSANAYDRLISFGYVGELQSFPEDAGANTDTNFGVCCSSDVSAFDYLTEDELKQYSDNTGTGVTDITMLQTGDGFPMQAHTISLTTPDEFTHKLIEGPSAYTKKYHMTYIYVFHNFDGYRGKLKNAIAYDRDTVINQDKLKHEYVQESDPAKPVVTDRYKVFLINAPYSIFNNADNVMYGVALLMETNYDVNLHLEPGALELEELGVDTFNAIFENSTTGTKYNATNESVWTINKHGTNIAIDKGLLSNTDTPGNYEVTATYNGYTATGIVRIREPYPVSLTITPADTSIWQGQQATIKVEVTMSNGAKNNVTDIADVILPDLNHTGISLNSGVITNTDTPGNYTINATYKGLTANASLEVKAITCTSIDVSPSSTSVEQGAPVSYTATAHLSDGTTKDITNEGGQWTVSGTGTDISIHNGAIADNQTVGSYTIKVEYKGVTGTASLTITEKFVPYVTINPSSGRDILLGLTTSFTAKYYATKGTATTITSDSNAVWTVTKVSGSDTLPSISKGSVSNTDGSVGVYEVKCTYNGASATAPLKIHDFTYQVIIEWPDTGTTGNDNDWDLHAQAFSGGSKVLNEVSFDVKKAITDDGTGGIWLDMDAKDGGKEVMSVDGHPGDYVTYWAHLYSDTASTPLTAKVVNKAGTTLATKSIPTCPAKDSDVQLFKLDLGNGQVTVL
jgi:hypothetical protein